MSLDLELWDNYMMDNDRDLQELQCNLLKHIAKDAMKTRRYCFISMFLLMFMSVMLWVIATKL